MSSLRHKLWLGFGALLAILLAVSILSWAVMTRYSHALERVFRENYDSAVYCDAMKGAMQQLNLRAQFLVWDEPSAAGIDATAQEKIFEQNLANELGNITLPGEQEHANKLANLWTVYKPAYQSFEMSSAAQRPDMYRSELLPQLRDIEQTAQWIADANMTNMVSVDGQVKRTMLEVRTLMAALVITGTIAAAAAVGATGASILRALGALKASAMEIEAGNLDLRIDAKSRDEIGQVASAFNSMTARLREFRRLDHDKLARTQQTTQLAIDSLPDAVFIIGPDGLVEISNLSAATHFGIQRGVTVGELEARLKWLAPLYESAKSGGPPAEDKGYASAVQLFEEGREIFLLPRAVPMINIDKRPIGICFILLDVTRLRAADEAKSDLVSTVSHELRTPLTSIRMALGLLNSRKFGATTEKQASLLAAASEDSERLYRILENLLSISRIESGRVEFQFQPLSPEQIISHALDPMRPAFAEKQIRLTVNIAQNLPMVLADPAAIGSALSNLLTNALKFTPRSGEVTVGAAANGELVEFTVHDTGPGIPPQYAGRIFDKFFRVPGREQPGGAGLGLTIAREVVEAHGGVIELCPTQTPGSRFRFTLPQPHGARDSRTIAAAGAGGV